MKQQPPSWGKPTLLDCSQFVRGVTYTKSDAADQPASGLIPIVRANNIQARGFEFNDLVYVPANLVSAEQVLKCGDVVVATSSGSISVVGKAAQVRKEQPMSFGAFCGVLRPSPAINARYFGHFFSSKAYRDAVSNMARGVNINNLRRDHFQAINIPLAPLAEQKRIADKLDTVLTRVDAVNTCLARVALILKRFRQSVLAAATSGRLTEDWRNDSRPDASDIPLNWERRTLRHCITSMTGGASPSVEDYAPTGVLALNKGDIKLYGLLAGKKDQKYVPGEFAEVHRTKFVQQGDLLVTLRDLSNKADFLGLIAQFMGTEVALPTQGMYALTVAENTVPKFLMYFSNSPIYREVMKREKVGATQVHLRNDQFLDIPIALPPVKEQAEIVCRVETLFAFADRLDARLQTAQTATERLTPALLAKAFRGELVPQDPNDEPASELLRRLQADRPASKSTQGRRAAV